MPPPSPQTAKRARRFGYLVGRHPAISHTFIAREIDGLRTRGWGIETFSLWRTADEDLLTQADREERDRTFALLPPTGRRLFGFLLAHLRALRNPRQYFGLLAGALALGGGGIRRRLLPALWFAEAVLIHDRCRARGLEHLHVHLGGSAAFVGLLVGRISRRAGTGVTWSLTVHGPHEFYAVEKERLATKVEEADLVVCISDFARSQLMGASNETTWEKLRVVRCGVDTTAFHLPERSPRPKGTFRILNVGRLDPLKGQGVLLTALAELDRRGRDVSLTVIGGGERQPMLEDMARELGVEARVHWAGAVGQDRIRDFYADADVFCLPSFAEGIPIVLMEAMAMEVPVLTTWIAGIPELITSEEDGLLVRPGRPDELADALERLAADPELRRELGRNGRARIEREYRIDRNVEELIDVFDEVLP